MKTFLGVDLGTSSIKLSLINENKQIISEAERPYPIFRHGLFSEQNPLDWWNAFESALDEILNEQDKKALQAISFSGQMHGLVILDKDDNVVRPCILWNDGRSEKEVLYLNNTIGKERLNDLTGNMAYAGFTAPKILWVKNNEADVFKKINKIMLPKDYLVYQLTGHHVTDYSDASGTLLLNCKEKCWSKEMIEICGIKEYQLPELHESYDCVGMVKEEFKRKHGLGDVKIYVGAGDNAAASIGMGIVNEGEINISLGTSGTIFIPTDAFVKTKKNELHSFASVTGKWHLMGCILTAASARKWWLEDILKTSDYKRDEIDLAKGNTQDLFFLPYLSGERSPHNDTNAKGAFIGLTHTTKKEDMSKAIIEGVSFALKDCLKIAKEEGRVFKKATLCGGGSKSKVWCQMIADIFDLDVYVGEGSPSFGAALIAYKGFNNIDFSDVLKGIKYNSLFKPNESSVDYYQDKYKVFRKLYPALKNI